MEYTQELVEKIRFKMESAIANARLLQNGSIYVDDVQNILESFLPINLPPCPVCGGEVKLQNKDCTPIHRQGDIPSFMYWAYCTVNGDHMGQLVHSDKQEAIDAYLATPYCKLYLEEG